MFVMCLILLYKSVQRLPRHFFDDYLKKVEVVR